MLAFVLSVILLPIAILLLILIGLRVFKCQKLFFTQKRIGHKGREFQLLKFRTMSADTSKTDGERLTTRGKWLRKTSLDEVPQLLNILKGEMSFVGPRPLLPEYGPLYSQEQQKRHDVKPGITGWAQVKGRNKLSWAEQFELDVWYVQHQGFWLDLKIMALTVLRVVTPGTGEVQMRRPFTGNNQTDSQN